MMKTQQMTAIAEALATAQAERDALTKITLSHHSQAQRITQEVRAAELARDHLRAELQERLIAHATGDGTAADVKTARDALASAEKDAEAARQRYAEADELAAVVAGLNRKLEPIDARIVALRQQAADAHEAEMIAELRRRIDVHTEAAATLSERLADALALEQHFYAIGKPQDVGSGAAKQTFIGVFAGKSLPPFGDLLNAARERIVAGLV
jgi:hypothetical protein